MTDQESQPCPLTLLPSLQTPPPGLNVRQGGTCVSFPVPRESRGKLHFPPASQWKKPRQQGKRCAVHRRHRPLSAGAISSLGLLGFVTRTEERGRKEGVGLSHRRSVPGAPLSQTQISEAAVQTGCGFPLRSWCPELINAFPHVSIKGEAVTLAG